MDLSALGSTLPPGLADAEREMGDKFRAAALSITTFYKASLGATKQAYSVGYSAALADVLATVQSALTAGQDASTALSRLMDWAEAREAAIAAFASDEGEEAPAPPARPRTANPTRQSVLSHLNAPNRASSAPIPDNRPRTSNTEPPAAVPTSSSLPHRLTPINKLSPGPCHDQSDAMPVDQSDVMVSRAMLASTDPYPLASSSNNTPASNFSASTSGSGNIGANVNYQPTPPHLMSSSPASPSTSSLPRAHHFLAPNSRPSKHLPIKYHNPSSSLQPLQPVNSASSTSQLNPLNSNQASSSSSIITNSINSQSKSTIPQTTFNPVLPLAGMPFSIRPETDNTGLIPSQQANIGSKRPMIDPNATSVDESTSPGGLTTGNGSQRGGGSGNGGGGGGGGNGGRAAKRRSLGNGLGKVEEVVVEKEEREGRERRRGGRRGHGGG